MANPDLSGFYATVGIECHVQLKTRTKLFAAVGNDAREAAPNTLISHICLGLPGSLPVLNEKAVELACRAAYALNSVPQAFSKFDRKHYFYPDLPKGYQITQYDQPIISGGSVEIEVEGQKQQIGITRAHLEEDAGKNSHPEGADYSLVDLNRAGTPLLEIVSEPDMHSSAEAKAYARELYLLMRYSGVSDADLYHGNMRFDVNVSVSDDPRKLGTRTETKNLNSFRSVEKAVEFEVSRQVGELQKGNKIVQETRGWNDAKQKTFSQRGKEEAHDYRYFPEPDLPPVRLDERFLSTVQAAMPILPPEWRKRLESLGLDVKITDILLEAELEQEGTTYLRIIETHLHDPSRAKTFANWFVNVEIPLYRQGEVDVSWDNESRRHMYDAVYELLRDNKLSATSAKSLLHELLTKGVSPANMEKYAQEQGYLQESDTSALQAIVDNVIAENPTAVEDIKNGEVKAVGFLVGQVMKKSLGTANPAIVRQLIESKLGL